MSCRVAILDSGIHKGHPHLQGMEIQGFSVEGEQAPFSIADDYSDRTGHGTACAAAMFRLNPEIELLAIRVLDDELTTTHLNLAYAIQCAADRGTKIINLSLGTTEASSAEAICQAVDYATSKSAICVAAAHPQGKRLWPAELPSVLSASCHRSCPLGDMYRIQGPVPRFLCHGYPRPIEGRPPTDNLYGPSIAAAHLSARAAEILATEPLDFDQLIRALERRCRAQINAPTGTLDQRLRQS